MMRHEGPHDGDARRLPADGCGCSRALHRSRIGRARRCAMRSREIERRALRIDHRGKRRRVGGDDGVLAQAAFEPQARHAEVRVLVGELQIARVVGGFGNAPGNAELDAILDLSLHDQAIGLLQQAAGRRAHDQRRHEVFEHRARPGDERRACSDRRDRAPEPKPVARRNVVLGDGDEARQARLGGEQVVAVRIERALVAPVADREEPALADRSRKPNCIASDIPARVDSRVASRRVRSRMPSSSRCRSRRQLAIERCAASPRRAVSPPTSSPSSPASARAMSARVAASGASARQSRREIRSFALRPRQAPQRAHRGRVETVPRRWCASAVRREAPAKAARASCSASRPRSRTSDRQRVRSIQSRHALASAIRCAARLPLSTVET